MRLPSKEGALEPCERVDRKLHVVHERLELAHGTERLNGRLGA
jgi:hypothetical protein